MKVSKNTFFTLCLYAAARLLLLTACCLLPFSAHAAGAEGAPDGTGRQGAIKNVASLFSDRYFYELNPPAAFTAAAPEGQVTVQTTLRPELQQRLMACFARSAPLIAAAVVLDAKTGAVLAMGNQASRAGASLLPEGTPNYCIYGGFPAASLVKIITASVALEKKGFDINHIEPVSGRYHTLYRSQVGIERSPYKPEQVPMEKAFALSINPYFGKLWLDSFADRDFLDMGQDMLFNMPLEFDLPVTKSRIVPPVDNFQRAEVASGYNTRTTISPLHAALIASLPVNGGKILQPYLIDRITDANGKLLYAHTAKTLSQPLSPRSVAQLNQLMQATVENGTARGSFTYAKQIGAAHGWTMGGKTGSIDLPEHTGRCDWFAGFGQQGQTSVAVACILVHGAQRTMRSSFVGAEMIRACLDPAGVHTPRQVQAKKKPAPAKTTSMARAAPTASSKTKVKAPVQEAAKPKSKKRKSPQQNTGG
jgi:penicillin-binding protein A